MKNNYRIKGMEKNLVKKIEKKNLTTFTITKYLRLTQKNFSLVKRFHKEVSALFIKEYLEEQLLQLRKYLILS